MKKLTVFVLLLMLLSCNNDQQSSGGAAGTTYLRTLYTAFGGGSLTISWIWLGDDGTIVHNPVHGVNPVRIEAEKKDNADNVGTYKMEGDKMLITWSNNKTDEWSIDRKDGKISIIDGGITTVPNEFEKGETIEGQFAAVALGGAFSRVQTMVFKKDGSFAIETSTAVSNEYVSEIGKTGQRGRYELDGNTLRMQFEDGKEQVATIAHWKDEDGTITLVINNSSFPQEK